MNLINSLKINRTAERNLSKDDMSSLSGGDGLCGCACPGTFGSGGDDDEVYDWDTDFMMLNVAYPTKRGQM